MSTLDKLIRTKVWPFFVREGLVPFNSFNRVNSSSQVYDIIYKNEECDITGVKTKLTRVEINTKIYSIHTPLLNEIENLLGLALSNLGLKTIKRLSSDQLQELFCPPPAEIESDLWYTEDLSSNKDLMKLLKKGKVIEGYYTRVRGSVIVKCRIENT